MPNVNINKVWHGGKIVGMDAADDDGWHAIPLVRIVLRGKKQILQQSWAGPTLEGTTVYPVEWRDILPQKETT